MEYNNLSIRRQDRLLEETGAIVLLESAEYGVLSMQAAEGGGYGIPLSFVWNRKSSLYLHCAPEGKKLDCLSAYPDISFCIVGKTRVIPDKFTTAYESILLSGKAHTGLPPEERMRALELLLDKYSSGYKETGMKYTEKSFHRTEVIRLDISSWSGKCKRIR